MKRALMSAANRIASFDKAQIAKEVEDFLILEKKDPELDYAMIEIEYADCGILEDGQIWVDYTIDIKHRHLNIYGHAHGGAIATIVDAGMGITAAVASEYFHLPTVDMSLLYHHVVLEGRHRIHCQTTHMGRKMVNCRCGLYDAQGNLCATSMAGYYVKE